MRTYTVTFSSRGLRVSVCLRTYTSCSQCVSIYTYTSTYIQTYINYTQIHIQITQKYTHIHTHTHTRAGHALSRPRYLARVVYLPLHVALRLARAELARFPPFVLRVVLPRPGRLRRAVDHPLHVALGLGRAASGVSHALQLQLCCCCCCCCCSPELATL